MGLLGYLLLLVGTENVQLRFQRANLAAGLRYQIDAGLDNNALRGRVCVQVYNGLLQGFPAGLGPAGPGNGGGGGGGDGAGGGDLPPVVQAEPVDQGQGAGGVGGDEGMMMGMESGDADSEDGQPESEPETEPFNCGVMAGDVYHGSSSDDDGPGGPRSNIAAAQASGVSGENSAAAGGGSGSQDAGPSTSSGGGAADAVLAITLREGLDDSSETEAMAALSAALDRALSLVRTTGSYSTRGDNKRRRLCSSLPSRLPERAQLRRARARGRSGGPSHSTPHYLSSARAACRGYRGLAGGGIAPPASTPVDSGCDLSLGSVSPILSPETEKIEPEKEKGRNRDVLGHDGIVTLGSTSGSSEEDEATER